MGVKKGQKHGDGFQIAAVAKDFLKRLDMFLIKRMDSFMPP